MVSYEDSRKKRVEENKKRLQQLNLHQLSISFRNDNNKNKKMAKKVKSRKQEAEMTPVRRSSRTADKPTPNYKENAMEPLLRGGPKAPRRYPYKRRDLSNRVYASDEDRAYAIDCADRLQEELDSAFPSFVKPMTQSHVTGGFWLSLPRTFCRKNLPHKDGQVMLVDEEGDQWETVYLFEKNGLSGGWRGFAIDHLLMDGDALVFQLTSPSTFKVHIIRVNNPDESHPED